MATFNVIQMLPTQRTSFSHGRTARAILVLDAIVRIGEEPVGLRASELRHLAGLAVAISVTAVDL